MFIQKIAWLSLVLGEACLLTLRSARRTSMVAYSSLPRRRSFCLLTGFVDHGFTYLVANFGPCKAKSVKKWAI